MNQEADEKNPARNALSSSEEEVVMDHLSGHCNNTRESHPRHTRTHIIHGARSSPREIGKSSEIKNKKATML